MILGALMPFVLHHAVMLGLNMWIVAPFLSCELMSIDPSLARVIN